MGVDKSADGGNKNWGLKMRFSVYIINSAHPLFHYDYKSCNYYLSNSNLNSNGRSSSDIRRTYLSV